MVSWLGRTLLDFVPLTIFCRLLIFVDTWTLVLSPQAETDTVDTLELV